MIERLRRSKLWPLAALALPALAAAGASPDAATPAAPSSIARENRLHGTTAWRIERPAMEREIEGYADQTSVAKGGKLQLFVNTTAPAFSLQVFRMGWYAGRGGRAVTHRIERPLAHKPLRPQPACSLPTADPTTSVVECQWRDPVVVEIHSDWTSGVYLVKLTAGGKGPEAGRESYIPFVVRDDASAAPYLYQLPVTTDQAYNNWGGQSLYQHNTACKIECAGSACPCTDPNVAPSSIVSFDRPYSVYVADRFARSGPPGYPTNPWNGKPIHPDNTIGAGLLFEWDLNWIRWLEREGFDLTYSTNLDTDARPEALRAHRAFLSTGHDEYWSEAMVCNVIAARDAGTNLGFLGENTLFQRVVFEPNAAGQAQRRMRKLLPRFDFMQLTCDPASGKTYDRASLLGLRASYFPAEAPIVVRNTTSRTGQWVFRGADLRDGDALPGLLGYEAEAPASFPPDDPQHLDYSVLGLSSPTFRDRGPLCTPPSTQNCMAMTAYRAASGAQVFATGSMFWPWALDAYSANPPGLETGVLAGVVAPASFSYDKAARLNPRVAQITLNVLERLADPVPPRCGDASLDFRLEPVLRPSGPRWPGGAPSQVTSRATAATPACSVTIRAPTGPVGDPATSPIAGFALAEIQGFAHCVAVGGPTGDGCSVDCGAGVPEACSGARPACNAIRAASYHVECHDH